MLASLTPGNYVLWHESGRYFEAPSTLYTESTALPYQCVNIKIDRVSIWLEGGREVLAQWRCEIMPAEQFTPLCGVAGWGCWGILNSRLDLPCSLFSSVREAERGRKYYVRPEVRQ